jgi:hypothetical protein
MKKRKTSQKEKNNKMHFELDYEKKPAYLAGLLISMEEENKEVLSCDGSK